MRGEYMYRGFGKFWHCAGYFFRTMIQLYLIYAVVLGSSSAFILQNCECQGSCPDGWVQYKGSCYYIFEKKAVSWAEATHHCLLHQSELVTLETNDEDMFLRSEIKRLFRNVTVQNGQEFWIGATDAGNEGTWSWYAGNVTLGYTDWFPGQPGSDGMDEDCAVIAASTSFIGWHDAPCDAIHHPICEISYLTESIQVVG